MYLKRLEIQGFKSFAESVEIEFEPGITVVVGPNGCGKSNLTEAVQWVLGEQSARALRGYKMEDVIFSGTTRRRPLGMAEVSLTFDNSGGTLPLPYQEIRITRRAYRSGEGEYFINKTPCRLRDIQELFASCGIGKAAFSIIGQGRIDELVSVRPEERRLFLEEASGVGRYRQRKADALNRLEETEQALVRLQDLLEELERRRAPLAEQARLANLYRHYQESIKGLELRLLEGHLQRLRDKAGQLAVSRQGHALLIERWQPRITWLEGDLLLLQTGLQADKERVARLEEQLAGVLQQRQEVAANAARCDEQWKSYRKSQEELRGRLQGLTGTCRDISAEIESLDKESRELRSQKSLIEETCLELSREKERLEREREQLNQRWDESNVALYDVIHQKTSVSSRIREIDQKKEFLLRQQDGFKRRVEKGRQRIGELKEQIRLKQAQLGEAEEKLLKMTGSRDKLRKQLQDWQGERQRLVSAVQQEHRRIEGERARLAVLKQADESREGYQRGVREILRARDSGYPGCRGIIGLVADIFSVEEKYEAALHAALGRSEQYLVCTNPEAAQEAISFLKSRNLGRASFLPLTAVERWNEKNNPGAILTGPEIIGRAADLVRCEKQFRNVAEFLLGRTYFAEDLTKARKFAERHYFRVRVVTLEGDMIQPGGLITGGKAVPTSEVLSRKREITRLSAVLEEHLKDLSELSDRLKEIDARSAGVEGQLREMENQHSRLEREQMLLRQQLKGMELELKQYQQFTRSFQLEGEEHTCQRDELEQQQATLQEELEQILAFERERTEERRALEMSRQECEQRLKEVQQRLSDTRVKLAALEQELKHHLRQQQALAENEKKGAQEQERLKNRLQELSEELERLEIQRQDCSLELGRLSEREEVLRRELEWRRRRASAAVAYFQAREKRMQRLKQMLWQKQQLLHHIDLQMDHLKGQMEQLYERSREIGCELGPDSMTRALSHQEESRIKNQLEEFREKLAGIGEVNLTAPVEYRELQERHDFLMSQKSDLIQGKAQLERLIREMDQLVASRFHKCYLSVKKNFESIFAELCEGGRAELLLTDESDLLSTGLDMVVVPKGKRPRHLSLLSGGEKALTGIAFLFALLKTRPSPFYLLDEIEAFLDVANLERFASYLKSMGENTQLVLISHRHQTMLVADALYGVTMEEPGVSKIVSVKLEERALWDHESSQHAS